MDNKIVLLGGTGFIGKKLAIALNRNAYEIVILSRSIDSAKLALPFAKSFYKWDTYDLTPAIEALNGSYAVYNLAGASIGNKKWTKSYKQEILQSRIEATSLLCRAIQQTELPPKYLINASAIGYYGDCGDTLLDENSPTGSDFLANVCKQWEDSVQLSGTNTKALFARIGIVLSLKGGALPKMLNPYKYYLGGSLGSGRQWFSWIHIDDLLGMLVWLLENPVFEGAVNLVSPNPVTMNELSAAISKTLRKPNFFRVPSILLKALMGESSALVLNSQKVSPAVALKHGYHFSFPNIESALCNLIS